MHIYIQFETNKNVLHFIVKMGVKYVFLNLNKNHKKYICIYNRKLNIKTMITSLFPLKYACYNVIILIFT